MAVNTQRTQSTTASRRAGVLALHINRLPSLHGTISNLWAKILPQEPLEQEPAHFTRKQLPRLQLTPAGVVGEQNRLASPERALLGQSTEHYELLRAAFPSIEALQQPKDAASGENILIDGLDRRNLCIGDVFGLQSPNGDWLPGILQVSSPRKPCRRWDKRYGSANGLSVRHFVLTNTCGGFFFRVLRPGSIAQGDRLVLVHRPNPHWHLERLGKMLYGSAGGHVDTWTAWTGTNDELSELCTLEDLAMREWRDTLLQVREERVSERATSSLATAQASKDDPTK